MRTGNDVKRDDLHAHQYEQQYVKPYEESEEGDSTKMILKAEELSGVYTIDDLNQTKQAEG